MTQLTLITNQRLLNRKQAAAPKVSNWLSWLNRPKVLNTLLLSMLVAFGISYLAIVNSTASDTFMVHTLNTRIQHTRESNQKLELDMSEVLSLPHVNEMSRQSNFVTAANVHYLDETATVALSQ
jgi:hypothetical protein